MSFVQKKKIKEEKTSSTAGEPKENSFDTTPFPDAKVGNLDSNEATRDEETPKKKGFFPNGTNRVEGRGGPLWHIHLNEDGGIGFMHEVEASGPRFSNGHLDELFKKIKDRDSEEN